MSGQNFTSQLCEIIKTCGESGIAHFSMRCDDIDVEFVMNGNVSLTPASRLYQSQENLDNTSGVYDNDTKQDELPNEPDIEELALEDPELFEQYMKAELDG